ncbi:ATP-grasp domain-containing protein [Dongshaea marina]|uniref:ATP-grasp domain-containing protein n=1 Tax=Dongshaea marina TaxID=2047966 RepID=UPI000D3EAF39|nr:ATP-grasp domain-containing protein [Dongshaea marina]
MLTVLVTGVGGGVGQGIIKSLKSITDLDIRIVTSDISAYSAGLYVSDYAKILPPETSPNHLEKLIELLNNENVSYYFPGTDIELYFCARNKSKIESMSSAKVIISPERAIEISSDKYKTFEFLKKNNFSHPATYRPEDIDYKEINYPIIVKPAIGCRSKGVSISKNEKELRDRIENEDGLIIQELIGEGSDEYTCTIIIVGNHVSDVLVFKRELRDGDTYKATPIKNKKICEYITEVALKLNVHGCCNFQLRIDSSGIPKIFEINCRHSGTTPFWTALGFNPVEYYLKKINDIEYKPEVNYDFVIMRYWSELLVPKKQIEKLSRSHHIKLNNPHHKVISI